MNRHPQRLLICDACKHSGIQSWSRVPWGASELQGHIGTPKTRDQILRLIVLFSLVQVTGSGVSDLFLSLKIENLLTGSLTVRPWKFATQKQGIQSSKHHFSEAIWYLKLQGCKVFFLFLLFCRGFKALLDFNGFLESRHAKTFQFVICLYFWLLKVFGSSFLFQTFGWCSKSDDVVHYTPWN